MCKLRHAAVSSAPPNTYNCGWWHAKHLNSPNLHRIYKNVWKPTPFYAKFTKMHNLQSELPLPPPPPHHHHHLQPA